LSESNTRIDGLSDDLKKETLRFNEKSDALKSTTKDLKRAESQLQEAQVEAANLARDFAAKAADLESTYKIDQALRRDLETSLTDMGQTLAQREAELMDCRQTIDRLNNRITGLETDNRSLVEKTEGIVDRFKKVRALLLEEEETEATD
jgi:chromosome segregation ATPase